MYGLVPVFIPIRYLLGHLQVYSGVERIIAPLSSQKLKWVHHLFCIHSFPRAWSSRGSLFSLRISTLV